MSFVVPLITFPYPIAKWILRGLIVIQLIIQIIDALQNSERKELIWTLLRRIKKKVETETLKRWLLIVRRLWIFTPTNT